MTVSSLAYVLDGGPPDWVFEQQLEVTVYVPLITILFSWVLIRWRAKAVLVAIVLAAVGAIVVLVPYFGLFGSGPGYQPSLPYAAAPWVAVAWPFVFIVALYRREKSRQNQSPETTRGSRP